MPNSEVATQMLEIFDKYAKKHKVTYFLLFGTCLGMVRDGDFIDDDVDVDIGVYGGDKNLKPLLNDLMANYDHNYYEYKGRVMRCEILMKYPLDINPLHKIGDKYYYLKKVKDGKVYGKEYPERFFDELGLNFYHNKKYLLPFAPREYLTYLYGDWKSKKPKGTGNLRELMEVKL